MSDETAPSPKPAPASIRAPLLFALMTTAFAGFLDAIGYTQLSGLYVSFMSGNSTRLGIDVAKMDMTVVVHSGCVIATFVLGGFAGTVFANRSARPRPLLILAAELGLLVLSLGLTQAQVGFSGLLPLAAAMGMQNVLHQSVDGADVGKSFITGTLFGIGQALAHYVCRTGPAAPALVQIVCWVAFVSGVVAGALAITVLSLRDALLLALLMLSLITLVVRATLR